MYFAISDNEGNTVDSFVDEAEAERALLTMASEDGGDDLLLLAYADDGRPVGDARVASDLRRRIVVFKIQQTGFRVLPTDSVRPTGGMWLASPPKFENGAVKFWPPSRDPAVKT